MSEQTIENPEFTRTEAFLCLGFACPKCGHVGMHRHSKAVQAAIFGNGVVYSCESCQEKLGLELRNTVVLPMPVQQAKPDLNRHERRIIQLLRK